jgi:hypothetical protein
MTGHEKRDIDAGLVAKAIGALAVFACLVAGATLLTMKFLGGPEETVKIQPLPPEPRLQADPSDDIAKLRAYEESMLERYSWVDRDKGIVRIPIDRAIEITAQRGLPSRTE